MKENKKKFYIKTWGCQINEYDSLTIINTLQQNKKYTETKNVLEAEILILNTCSIREKAHEKLFHQLGRWKDLKKNNKNIIIAVGGCVATQEGNNILKRAKFVDIIFGTQTLHKLPHMLEKHIIKQKSLININFLQLEKFQDTIKPKFTNYIASIPIMEGCNKYCSFCIVPYTRGREMSRPFYSLLTEINTLANNGIKEIQLLGQNVNSYKYIDKNKNKYTFAELLHSISLIKKIKRIRFITSNPMQFTDDIIHIYNKTNKIVNFLHLPIQSGSNKILKLMKRPYSISEYEQIIKKLKKIRPNIQISSDFIVGFPGETEDDFQDTIKIISKIKFDMSYSFIYSPRPGTPASKLKDNVDLETKKYRLQILQKKIKKQTNYWNTKIINSNQKILVEKFFNKKKLELIGKTENNRTVILQGQKNMIGKIIKVQITKKKKNFFKGIYIP
ncbi:tRNA-2-methylthio-N(6)-dimethylallyladenosine synthase [Buchnera aphidicola (Pterocallis alni)]|uniref:tRNA (N6-isopentenyl adenosine(37)-C2)-methylthiotransferase MiaB n=1 Tax=Buchnera aphidicola TaxID=9 RepID=UPI0034644CAB